MLTKKRQRRYLTEKEQHWLHQLEAFGNSRDEEALHRLRVEIKKIRALVQLTSAQRGKGAAAHFRGLIRMFRQAGTIREAGSQVRYLEERQFLSTEQRDRQAAVMEAASAAFAGQIGRYRKEGKRASRHLLTDIHAIEAGRVREWYALEIIRTGVLLLDTAHLHEARKKIKTLLYVYRLLPPGIAARVRLNTWYLDRLQDAIGQWHDALLVSDSREAADSPANVVIKRELNDNERIVKALSNGFHLEIHKK